MNIKNEWNDYQLLLIDLEIHCLNHISSFAFFASFIIQSIGTVKPDNVFSTKKIFPAHFFSLTSETK